MPNSPPARAAAPHLTLALVPPQLCCVCHGPGGVPCPWCHLIACDGCMPELHGAADGESWWCGQRKALREWEAMDHAVPLMILACACCREMLPVHAFCPSDLTPRRGHTRAGTPYIQPPARRCRDCRRALRLRMRERSVTSTRPPRARGRAAQEGLTA